MTVENAIRAMAGTFILASLAFGVEASPLFVSKHFLWLTAFVGANLLQSAFTHWCPAEMVFRRMGLKEGACATR